MLTNKTITDSTNNVMAKSLQSATTTIDVSAATAPSTGQALVATSPSTAAWANVSSIQAVRTSSTLANSSTSSVSYVDMVTQTFTPSAACNLLVLVTFIWQQSNSSGINYAAIHLDGAVQGNDPTIEMDVTTSGKNISQSMQLYIPTVTATAHTVALKYKVASGGTTASVINATVTILEIKS